MNFHSFSSHSCLPFLFFFIIFLMWVYDIKRFKQTYLFVCKSFQEEEEEEKLFERRIQPKTKGTLIQLSGNPLSSYPEKLAYITKIPITFPGLDSTILKFPTIPMFTMTHAVQTEYFFKQKTNKLLTQWLYWNWLNELKGPDGKKWSNKTHEASSLCFIVKVVNFYNKIKTLGRTFTEKWNSSKMFKHHQKKSFLKLF